MALFFPSYLLRDRITEKILTGKEIIFEKQNMNKEDKAKLLKNFTLYQTKRQFSLPVQQEVFQKA